MFTGSDVTDENRDTDLKVKKLVVYWLKLVDFYVGRTLTELELRFPNLFPTLYRFVGFIRDFSQALRILEHFFNNRKLKPL